MTGRGISWCAICDGPLYRDKTVAVVGGGNSALEEALYLAEICQKVYLIHRRDEFRADQILQEKVKNKETIEIIYNGRVVKLNEQDNHLSSIEIEQEGKSKVLTIDGLFIYIGFVPDTNFIKSLPIQLDNGYIVVDSDIKTTMPRVYACGDVIKKNVYQIATAVGEGATAALAIKKEKEKEKE